MEDDEAAHQAEAALPALIVLDIELGDPRVPGPYFGRLCHSLPTGVKIWPPASGRGRQTPSTGKAPEEETIVSSEGADEAALERSYAAQQPWDMSTAEGMLREFKQIMDRLGVVFFLRQGTCLGAVRDKAFIPWDDDLDLGSVLGLHGLTEKSIGPVADAFRDKGYFVKADQNAHYMSLAMMKSSIRTDWTACRVIDDSIYQFPGVRTPVRLFTRLREIDFIGEKFLVPNPPEEYLRFKYGEDWMTPKKTGYEKDVMEMIPESPLPGNAGRLKQLLSRHILRWRACRLTVLDHEDEPVSGAEVVIAGLGLSRTNRRGYARFYLPGDDCYALVIRHEGHEEVLYQELMTPGGAYVYRPDPSSTSGRLMALSSE